MIGLGEYIVCLRNLGTCMYLASIWAYLNLQYFLGIGISRQMGVIRGGGGGLLARMQGLLFLPYYNVILNNRGGGGGQGWCYSPQDSVGAYITPVSISMSSFFSI